MNRALESGLWFAAGVTVSALILLLARTNPSTDVAPTPVRVQAAGALDGSVAADVVP